MWLTHDHFGRMGSVLACGAFAVLLARTRQSAAAALGKKTALIKLLEEVAVAAGSALTVDEALQACLDAVAGHTRWPVGHALVRAPDGSGNLVSSRQWHPRLNRGVTGP